jgi:hypothetical protein
MVIGITLLKMSGGSYESPTFMRQGLSATFSVDIMKLTATSLLIDVEHKNIEDTSWSSAGTFASITSTGVKSVNIGTLKEQIRFVYTITASDDYDGVHLNMLTPAWWPN